MRRNDEGPKVNEGREGLDLIVGLRERNMEVLTLIILSFGL